MNETMTPKERWLAVLNREQPDRLPMAYWGTVEMTRKEEITHEAQMPKL